MGKGDKRTKRGKLFRGSNGKTVPNKKVARPAKPEPKAVKPAKAAKETAPVAAAPATTPPAAPPAAEE